MQQYGNIPKPPNRNKHTASEHSQLPKINSQRRIHTTTSHYRKTTTQDTTDKSLINRPLSNNGRAKSVRNFTSKAVNYEVTNNIYNRKIEELEKQHYATNQEMKNIQEEISKLRQNIGSIKRNTEGSMNQSSASIFSKLSAKKISVNDNSSLKTQLKNITNKILKLRSKNDNHIEKNKVIQAEIDVYRKEISTFKGINEQLEATCKKTIERFNQEFALSKRLDMEIAFKSESMHKKKVENMHVKANMIKQYDTILKNLDKELNQDKEKGEDSRANFYLTGLKQHSQVDSLSQTPNQGSNSKDKVPKISNIQDKLRNYEKEFQDLKEKIGSDNLEDITKKFTEEYQNNFHQYNFINEVYQVYEQANKQQFQLLQKKAELIKQIQAKRPESKIKEIDSLRGKAKAHLQKQQKIKANIFQYKKIYLELRQQIINFISNEKDMNEEQRKNSIENLSQKNISSYLHKIYQRNSNFFSAPGRKKSSSKMNNFKIANISGNRIQELLEEAKHQADGKHSNLKETKLMSREQMQQKSMAAIKGQGGSRYKTKEKK